MQNFTCHWLLKNNVVEFPSFLFSWNMNFQKSRHFAHLGSKSYPGLTLQTNSKGTQLSFKDNLNISRAFLHCRTAAHLMINEFSVFMAACYFKWLLDIHFPSSIHLFWVWVCSDLSLLGIWMSSDSGFSLEFSSPQMP